MNWPNFNKITKADFKPIQRVLEDVADGLKSPRARRVFNSALDYLRPYVQSLGLRITSLTRHRVEVLLPAKMRNLDEQNQVLEGAVISAATHAFRLLWNENKLEGDFQLQITSVHLQKQKVLQGDLRLRWELSELHRESIFAELIGQKRSRQETVIGVYNQDDMLVAQVDLKAEISLTEMLEWK